MLHFNVAYGVDTMVTSTEKHQKDQSSSLPYNTDVDILDKILKDLKNTGNEGISLDTLWADINETKNVNKRYTLNMAKFLGLIDTDGIKVWLTPLGRSIGYTSIEKRNTTLAHNMPEKYRTIFKWIKFSPSHEMSAGDIKAQFVTTFGNPASTLVLDRSIASFLNYCQYIGLLEYKGKGKGAKAILTDFGRKVMDLRIDEQKELTVSQPTKESEIESLPDTDSYPIRIITRDRNFKWDIKSEADLGVVDSVINSIKSSWKNPKKKEVKPKS